MIYDTLVGLPFQHGVQDCYTLIRDFYKLNFDIELPNYARPNGWWNEDLDLYMTKYFKNGFRSLDVHPSEWQLGDVFLMSILSKTTNHAGVLVENGRILHHFTGRFSTVDSYKGIWRNCTTAVLRHKDVNLEQTPTQVELSSLLPYSVQRKIDDRIKSKRTPPEAVDPLRR